MTHDHVEKIGVHKTCVGQALHSAITPTKPMAPLNYVS